MHHNYDIKLTVLSPTHIGAGGEKNWQRGADFVHLGDAVHVLDFDKMWHQFSDRDQARYLDFVSKGRFAEVEKLISDEVDFENASKYTFEYGGELKSREIKTVVRDGNGHAFIPGTSIKGAISSALLHIIDSNVRPEYKSEQTANELLGTFDRALGRYIRPYDTAQIETEIADIELYNLYNRGLNWKGDYKDGFIIILESYKRNATAEFRLSLATGLGDFIKEMETKFNAVLLPKYYKNILTDKPLEKLFSLINQYTYEHIQRELLYFEKYNNDESIDYIIDQLNGYKAILKDIPPTSCLLRMAFGSGFHGITGDWRFNDHTSTIDKPDNRNLVYNQKTRQKEPARYKSRRLSVFPNAEMMGFVRLDAM